jgi:hypothetical protein
VATAVSGSEEVEPIQLHVMKLDVEMMSCMNCMTERVPLEKFGSLLFTFHPVRRELLLCGLKGAISAGMASVSITIVILELESTLAKLLADPNSAPLHHIGKRSYPDEMRHGSNQW